MKCKLGNIIFCKDGTRFLVVTMKQFGLCLVDLDTNEVVAHGIIENYINAYHKGIATIIDSINQL